MQSELRTKRRALQSHEKSLFDFWDGAAPARKMGTKAPRRKFEIEIRGKNFLIICEDEAPPNLHRLAVADLEAIAWRRDYSQRKPPI